LRIGLRGGIKVRGSGRGRGRGRGRGELTAARCASSARCSAYLVRGQGLGVRG